MKIILGMDSQMRFCNTIGLPAILIAKPCIIKFAYPILLSDLQYIDELYAPCEWAVDMKALLVQALQLKKELTVCEYYGENQERQKLMMNWMSCFCLHLMKIMVKEKHYKKTYTSINNTFSIFYLIQKFRQITMGLKEQ